MRRCLPRATISDGRIMLECNCGEALPYPIPPVEFTLCENCGSEWMWTPPLTKVDKRKRRRTQ